MKLSLVLRFAGMCGLIAFAAGVLGAGSKPVSAFGNTITTPDSIGYGGVSIAIGITSTAVSPPVASAGATPTPTMVSDQAAGTQTITYMAYDSDGDNCPDIVEMSDDPGVGGRRDFENSYDYFNPDKGPGSEHIQRVSDILAVVAQYHKDQYLPSPPNTPNPDYTTNTDRTAIGANPWNLGPPDGIQRVDDILAAVKQYHHDCGPVEVTVDVAQDCNGNIREESDILDENNSITEEGCVISRDDNGNITMVVHEKFTQTKGEIASFNCSTCFPPSDPGIWYHTSNIAYMEQLWPPGRICIPRIGCTPQTVIVNYSMVCGWDYYSGPGVYDGATVNWSCETSPNANLPWHLDHENDVQCCTQTAGTFEFTARVQALFQYGDAPLVLQQRTWHLYCRMGPWEVSTCGGWK